MKYLEGRAIVVTGAGSGLGAAYARNAAQHGANVVVNDIDASGAETTAAEIGNAVVDTSDISQWDGAAAAIETCITAFGRIDGLVNNAGIVRVSKPQDATEAELRHVIEVNLLGSAFCGVHALKRMIAQGSGSIVNVTSGAQLGAPTVSGYAASKGGITSLTYAWAASANETGVRVNAVSPDAATPLALTLASSFPEVQAGTSSTDSNAAAVTYLLSDLSSDVNGQIVLTGGERMTLLTKANPLRPAARSTLWTVDSVAQQFESWT